MTGPVVHPHDGHANGATAGQDHALLAAQESPADPDDLVDPRVRALLERYAGLSGAALREVGPDCFELAVPRTDRACFGGRGTIRVALSLRALEIEADAEMAVVGSAFVEHLIAAVRQHGARLVAGDVPASISAAAASTQLDIPVRNGRVLEAEVATARHAVGRLVARVTVRAGTSVQEYLVESSLFDLTTGLPLGADVADACAAFAATAPRAHELSKNVHASARIAARPMDELIPMMLGDLEQRLSPEVERQRAEAGRALEVELARIDRYYTGMLEDIGGRGTGIPDAAARRAIQAEHARRRDEEIRRHDVRASVHPVQLLEWTVPVQRAEWPLLSDDGHRASIVGERTLVAQGAWVIGCPHCGALAPVDLVVCTAEHTGCSECAYRCSVCEAGFCRDHGLAACHVDGRPACEKHARTCPCCRQPHCSSHESICDDGGHAACSACVSPCAHCGRAVCESHAVRTAETSPLGARRLCADCIRYCEGGTNEPVGLDEVGRCASCERSVCRNHQATCAVDGQVHCSRHLRRTDRSRRLVCEHDRAACAYEPHAILAADEVTACASCGKLACEVHTGVCVEDGERHCSSHLAPLQDRVGSFACEPHRSVCHVDRKTYSLTGTQECPVCARKACSSHSRACSSCARTVCTADIMPGAKAICTTCAALQEISDPSDAVIQAALIAQGDGAAKAKRWRQARDATHVVVELDLGWTRRVVFTVRHGEARPRIVVRHSVLGSAVARR